MIESRYLPHRQPFLMSEATPDYEAVAEAIERLGGQHEPAEVHGTLTGLLCANEQAPAELWLQHLFASLDDGDLLAAEAVATLRRLHAATSRQLSDPSCEFRLLLPDDDASLDARVHALGEWCQGFLAGLSLGGIKDFRPLPEDAREIVEDIVEIARADSSYTFSGSEEDENAYAELMEYLRVGVLLVNEEIQPTQAPPVLNPTVH